MGLISENITETLNSRHGIRHPETGEELTLMEAIQIGLYDPDSRQLRDIKTGELLSLYDSRHICPTDVQHRLIKMGVLKLPPMELEQALKNGWFGVENFMYLYLYILRCAKPTDWPIPWQIRARPDPIARCPHQWLHPIPKWTAFVSIDPFGLH